MNKPVALALQQHLNLDFYHESKKSNGLSLMKNYQPSAIVKIRKLTTSQILKLSCPKRLQKAKNNITEPLSTTSSSKENKNVISSSPFKENGKINISNIYESIKATKMRKLNEEKDKGFVRSGVAKRKISDEKVDNLIEKKFKYSSQNDLHKESISNDITFSIKSQNIPSLPICSSKKVVLQQNATFSSHNNNNSDRPIKTNSQLVSHEEKSSNLKQPDPDMPLLKKFLLISPKDNEKPITPQSQLSPHKKKSLDMNNPDRSKKNDFKEIELKEPAKISSPLLLHEQKSSSDIPILQKSLLISQKDCETPVTPPSQLLPHKKNSLGSNNLDVSQQKNSKEIELKEPAKISSSLLHKKKSSSVKEPDIPILQKSLLLSQKDCETPGTPPPQLPPHKKNLLGAKNLDISKQKNSKELKLKEPAIISSPLLLHKKKSSSVKEPDIPILQKSHLLSQKDCETPVAPPSQLPSQKDCETPIAPLSPLPSHKKNLLGSPLLSLKEKSFSLKLPDVPFLKKSLLLSQKDCETPATLPSQLLLMPHKKNSLGANNLDRSKQKNSKEIEEPAKVPVGSPLLLHKNKSFSLKQPDMKLLKKSPLISHIDNKKPITPPSQLPPPQMELQGANSSDRSKQNDSEETELEKPGKIKLVSHKEKAFSLKDPDIPILEKSQCPSLKEISLSKKEPDTLIQKKSQLPSNKEKSLGVEKSGISIQNQSELPSQKDNSINMKDVDTSIQNNSQGILLKKTEDLNKDSSQLSWSKETVKKNANQPLASTSNSSLQYQKEKSRDLNDLAQLLHFRKDKSSSSLDTNALDNTASPSSIVNVDVSVQTKSLLLIDNHNSQLSKIVGSRNNFVDPALDSIAECEILEKNVAAVVSKLRRYKLSLDAELKNEIINLRMKYSSRERKINKIIDAYENIKFKLKNFQKLTKENSISDEKEKLELKKSIIDSYDKIYVPTNVSAPSYKKRKGSTCDEKENKSRKISDVDGLENLNDVLTSKDSEKKTTATSCSDPLIVEEGIEDSTLSSQLSNQIDEQNDKSRNSNRISKEASPHPEKLLYSENIPKHKLHKSEEMISSSICQESSIETISSSICQESSVETISSSICQESSVETVCSSVGKSVTATIRTIPEASISQFGKVVSSGITKQALGMQATMEKGIRKNVDNVSDQPPQTQEVILPSTTITAPECHNLPLEAPPSYFSEAQVSKEPLQLSNSSTMSYVTPVMQKSVRQLPQTSNVSNTVELMAPNPSQPAVTSVNGTRQSSNPNFTHANQSVEVSKQKNMQQQSSNPMIQRNQNYGMLLNKHQTSQHLRVQTTQQQMTSQTFNYRPHMNQQPINANVRQHMNQQPINANVRPYMNQQPMTANVRPYMNQQPTNANVRPHMNQLPTNANVRPHMNQLPRNANVRPHMNQLPTNANVRPHMNQQPTNANVRPHMNQQPTNANVRPHMNQQPTNANVRQHMNQQPINANVTHHMNQQPMNANVRQPMNQQPMNANVRPHMNQQPRNANVRPHMNQQSRNANVMPHMNHQPTNANVRPHMNQQHMTTNVSSQLNYQQNTMFVRSQMNQQSMAPAVMSQMNQQPLASGVMSQTNKQQMAPAVMSQMNQHPMAPAVMSQMNQQQMAPVVMSQMNQQPTAPAVMSQMNQQQMAPVVMSQMNQQPIAPVVMSQMNQQPMAPVVMSQMNQQPMASAIMPQTNKQQMAPVVMSQMNQQPVTSAVVSQTSKQQMAPVVMSQMKQQPMIAHVRPQIHQHQRNSNLRLQIAQNSLSNTGISRPCNEVSKQDITQQQMNENPKQQITHCEMTQSSALQQTTKNSRPHFADQKMTQNQKQLESKSQNAMLVPNTVSIENKTCFLCGLKATVHCCGHFYYCSQDHKKSDFLHSETHLNKT